MNKVVSFSSHTKPIQGIITGCDIKQEWMLKWWLYYAQKNSGLPISVIDFGMSKSARNFLTSKVNVIDGNSSLQPFTKPSHYTFPSNWPKKWIHDAAGQRPFYFAKILATRLSPYKQSLWIDLDCKILESPVGAFAYIDEKQGASMALDTPETALKWRSYNFIRPDSITYQAGVIAFNQTSTLMEKWRSLCIASYETEFSDQTAIINFLASSTLPLKTMPSFFNHLFPHDKIRMGIAHYGGQWHKLCLLKEINTFKPHLP